MTELEKLLAGELFNYSDTEIYQLHAKAYFLLMKINNNISAENWDEKRQLLKELLPNMDDTTTVLPPFRCDLGFRIKIGKNVIINYNCSFLDNAPIEIGDNCLIGPDCHFYTSQHPVDFMQRRKPIEHPRPIKIGNDTWIGGNVTICPGVTIGERCIVGAGSVVTHNVESDTMVAGNPAKVIKLLTPENSSEE